MIFRTLVSLYCVTLLSGCASILAGTTQDIMVNTNPPAADCMLNRKGEMLGRIPNTPASLKVEKTKEDMTILCKKEGYQDATYLNKSGLQPAVWGNIVLGGLIGWGVDSALGADNKYDSPVNLSLVPANNVVQAPSPYSMGGAADAAQINAIVPTAPVVNNQLQQQAPVAAATGTLGVLKPITNNVIQAPVTNTQPVVVSPQPEAGFFKAPPTVTNQ